jgi:hypothetical protein
MTTPLEEYLQKKAGLFSGMQEGATRALTGIGLHDQRMMRGFSPADAYSKMHGAGQLIGQGATKGALGAAGALAVGGAVVGAQRLYEAATKARDFRAMLEANPDLVQKHEENPRLFNQMFTTLRSFNPSFSSDPVVAGGYIRKMVEEPTSAAGLVTDALSFRDKTRNPLVDQITRSAMSGTGRK